MRLILLLAIGFDVYAFECDLRTRNCSPLLQQRHFSCQREVYRARGEPGQAGKRGEKGASGEKGNIGVKGQWGVQGEQGAPGLIFGAYIGPKGKLGEVGERGETAPTGQVGSSGSKGQPGRVGQPGHVGHQEIGESRSLTKKLTQFC